MASAPEIINWGEAMEQVGDDEEFLRELLVDLRNEMEAQVVVIQGIIQNPQDNPFDRIMKAAHVIKGAAANLMCGQLREASYQLEQAASKTHQAGGVAAPMELQQSVQAAFQQMQQAAQNYVGFLQSLKL